MESSRDKEIFDNDVLGSEEVQQRSSSSSFAAAAAAGTYRTGSSKEGGEISDTDQSIKRVEVPVQILGDRDGEEITELVLLRIPENKLNSAILKPVFRVKILEPDHAGESKDIKINGIESSTTSAESSTENELSNNRTRASIRRRIRINSAQASPTFATPTDESEGRVSERSRPRTRQRIVKARKRTYVKEASLDRSGEWILNHRERSFQVPGDEKVSGRRDSEDKLEHVTSTSVSAYPPETSPTIRATTIRGSLPTSSKPSNVTRGFYITRSSDETSPPVPDAVTEDPSKDNYPPTTTNDAIDESTPRTDFATESHETVMPQVERIIYPTTGESSTHESVGTTFEEVGITTTVANEINSFGDLLKSTSDKFETVTSDSFSTNEDRLGESFTAITMTTTEKEESIEEPLITTFRPLITGEPASNPTFPMDSTMPEYSTDGRTEAIDKHTVTNVDESTEHVAETLKTSENSHYKSSPTLEAKSSTLPMTTEVNNMSITTQTEIPISRTTNLIDKATTYVSEFKRGRVRFTEISKPDVSAKASSRDYPRRTTESSDSDDSKINSVSRIKVSGINATSTEAYDKKVEPPSTAVEETGILSYTTRSSSRSRSRQRNTTKSFETDDSRIDLVIPKQVTPRSATKNRVVQYTSATEANRLSNNFMETTGNSYTSRVSSRKLERSQKTKKAFQVDNVRINSVTPIESTSRSGTSTEVYDKTVEPTITTTETNDLITNFVKTTETSYPSRSSSRNPDQLQKTTKFLEADDARINSVTPVEYTSVNDISTEVYDKTVEPTVTSAEAIDLSTTFVEITGSSDTSSLSSAAHDQPHRTTTSFETDYTTITSIAPPGGASSETYDENVDHTTTTGVEEETTKSRLQITKNSFKIDDSTIASITLTELVATDAITTEPYGTTVNHSSFTAENNRNPNFVEINGSRSYTRPLSEDTGTTTETYNKATDLLDPASTVDFVTNQEEVNPIESTNSEETTGAPAATTRSWVYNRQRNSTRMSEDNKTETINISSDVTLTFPDVTVTATSEPTTEVYVRTDRTVTTVESEAADTQMNEQQQISTEAVQGIGEAMTTLEVQSYDRTESTKQLYSTTMSGSTIDEKLEDTRVTPADTTIENIESTTMLATTTTSSSKNNNDLNVTRTTIQNSDKNTYFTADSYNSVTPVTPGETKRTRGRVRFTNFAGSTDEAGRNRKPVKQVVVRRRLAKPSNNQQQINDSTEEKTTNSKQHEIKEKENAKKYADGQLTAEKINSTKSMRRRVVVYRGRPRAESVTTTTMQSSSVSSNDVSEDIGRTRRRKWRKRLVLKRAKADDLDDQSIAETADFRQTVIDDSVNKDFRALGSHITEPVGQVLVNSAEREDEDIGDGEVSIYKSSGGFLRRPGTLIRPEGFNRTRTKSPGTSLPTTQATGKPAPFFKIRPIDTTEDMKTEDQSGRAQELAVTLADPPEIRAASTAGRLPFRTTTRKISTTFAPRTEAPMSTTPISRRRARPRGNGNNDKIVESVPTRPRRPAIIDYDYYVDDEVRLVVKPELKDKLFVTRKGGIRCLDQGNFAHPTSCKKFITCARMVNGQVLGTEYTCPDKLSFDPVGGICNWSAGLGCEDNPTP